MNIDMLIEKVRQDEIEFISLQFADLLGVVKEVVIPSRDLDRALNDGVWFDGSSIEGFARIQESDLFLKPDLDTYAVVPWHAEQGKTARFICDVYRHDGNPYEGDCRYILKKVMEEALEMGLVYNVGPEPEFYLFRRSNGMDVKPMDMTGYFDLSSYEGYKVIREIVHISNSFDIQVETTHHEVGQGQYEIDFRYGEAPSIADKLLTLKYTVKRVAAMHGLHATFMPKPYTGIIGSGLHIHQSLFNRETGKNSFYSEDDRYNLSPIARHFIAGQMKHIKALVAITNPLVNSYKRLVPGYEAPVYVTWANMNRSALIRIPRWAANKHSSARIELRCPDPTCNPYLAFAVMLKAGLDGIKNGIEPPEPVEENIFKFSESKLADRHIETLPTSLYGALLEMRQSELVRQALGEHLFNKYLQVKFREWDDFRLQVTGWEMQQYLDKF